MAKPKAKTNHRQPLFRGVESGSRGRRQMSRDLLGFLRPNCDRQGSQQMRLLANAKPMCLESGALNLVLMSLNDLATHHRERRANYRPFRGFADFWGSAVPPRSFVTRPRESIPAPAGTRIIAQRQLGRLKRFPRRLDQFFGTHDFAH